MIELSLDRPEYNSAVVTIEDGRALIDVTDRQGINGLNARLTQGCLLYTSPSPRD